MEGFRRKPVLIYLDPSSYIETITIPRGVFFEEWQFTNGEMRSDGLITAQAVNENALQAPREVSLVIDALDGFVVEYRYRSSDGTLCVHTFDGFGYAEEPFPEALPVVQSHEIVLS